MSTPLSIPTSRALICACLARRLSADPSAPPVTDPRYPDPWSAFAARYLPLIGFVLAGKQRSAGAAIRNLAPEDVLNRVYEKFNTVDPDQIRHAHSFRKWLRKVVASAVADAVRAAKSGVNKDAVPIDEASATLVADGVAEVFVLDEVENCFHRAIDHFCSSLTEQWKEPFVRAWATRCRIKGDLDSAALTDPGDCEEYRAIARRLRINEAKMYRFTSSFPARIEELLKREYEQLDQFDATNPVA